MTLTPTKGTDMAFLLLVLLSLVPRLGFITDNDGDGVKTLWDCNDNDPALTVLWCFDSDGDGAGECITPVPEVCLPEGQLPEDTRYTECGCTIVEIL
jgi:hypothetical protein